MPSDRSQVWSGFDGDVDGAGVLGDADAVEDVESVGGWRNESYVSPEGSLNFFPELRKSVRHGNGFIGLVPGWARRLY